MARISFYTRYGDSKMTTHKKTKNCFHKFEYFISMEDSKQILCKCKKCDFIQGGRIEFYMEEEK